MTLVWKKATRIPEGQPHAQSQEEVVAAGRALSNAKILE